MQHTHTNTLDSLDGLMLNKLHKRKVTQLLFRLFRMQMMRIIIRKKYFLIFQIMKCSNQKWLDRVYSNPKKKNKSLVKCDNGGCLLYD